MFELGQFTTSMLAVVLVVCAIAFLAIGGALARLWSGRKSRRRNMIAQGGEQAAERLLARAGYRILERQVGAQWDIEVDGKLVTIDVRADLLVTRRGQRYVAEVKTGTLAPDLCHGPTRRQLLEYHFVFGTERVLLVDMQAGAIREVGFPGAR